MEQALWKYLLSLFIFGSNGIIAAYIHVPSLHIVLLRALIGAISLAAVFLCMKNRVTVFHHPQDLFYLVLSGAAMAGNWVFLFEAYDLIGVSVGAVLNYCGPAIVVLLSPVVLHERLTKAKVGTLTAAMAGVVLIGGQAAVSGLNLPGLACGLAAALFFAGMVLLNKLIRHIHGLECVVVQLVTVCIVLIGYASIKQGLHISLSESDVVPVIWLGILNTGICYYLYFSSMRTLSVQTISICGYLEPLAAILLSGLLLHETMGALQWLGAFLIIGGAVWCEWRNRRQLSYSL
jgi:drug/metabolite transporter (DMT)-like permease